MGYTNSGLVAYTKLSPNHSGQRTHSIDRITPHCVVGQCSAEGLGDWFSKSSTQASSNYGIDKDGRVGLYVEEKNRSWCSSSSANDQRAVTIECASDTTEPYAFRDAVYQKLIVLCADICKRNGKKKLLWLKDKDKTLTYEPASDEMVLTVHRWFANKSCPGNWLMERMEDLAAKVTAQLGGESAPVKAGLRQGDKGAAIKAMQTMLIACGYSCGSAGADGDFGKNTLAGLKAFQKAAGLTVDGVYGETDEAALKKAYAAIPAPTPATDGKSDEQVIWETLNAAIGNAYGTAGLMGNLYAESALKATNLQNTGNKKLGMTDEQYTEAVDNGSYDADSFIHDGYGYGVAQWTYYSRKSALLSHVLDQGKSIGDLKTQLAFLLKEIKGYTSVWNALTTASSIRAASDIVLKKYEAPADQSETVQEKRAGYGQTYYDRYAKTAPAAQEETQETETKCYASAVIAVAVGEIGYKEKASNAHLDDKTANAGSANYTKYARDFDEKWPNWYNGKKNGFAWCDMFVDHCFLTAFGYENALRLLCQPEKSAGAGCTYSLRYYKNKGQFHTSGPKAGDQIFFGTSIDNSSHTGIVEKVDSSKVYTIEGNTSDQVARRSYALSNSRILGYGHPAYDVEGATPVPERPVPVQTVYYRVRRNWADKTSQIGAFTVLQNAINCVDANPGYAAFDDNGNQVYPKGNNTVQPYLVKVTISDLNYRQGPSTSYQSWGYIKPGVYTIVGELDGWGLLKAYASERNGWICLKYAEKV